MKDKRLMEDDEFKNYMAEYEEKNKAIVDEYNSENNFLSILKNKKIIIILTGIFMTLTIIGFSKAFFNIVSTSQKNPVKPVISTEADTGTNTQTETINDEENAINQKDIDKIKQNFHPFEEQNMEQPRLNELDNMSQMPVNQPNNSIPPQKNPDIGYQSVSMPNAMPTPMTMSNSPSDIKTPTNDTKTPQIDNNEYMSLKGIAFKNGEYVCYIKDGLTTRTYHSGESINGFTITNISDSSVTLVDSNGNVSNINK